ncbi:MAG: TVP38/TMEM64 family protein [Leptospirales bacterium]
MSFRLDSRAMKWGLRILILPAIGIGVLWIAFHQTLFKATLESHKDALFHLAKVHPVEAWFMWGVFYWIFTAAGLPGAVFLSLMSGFLFGPVSGMALDLVFASLGATTALLLFRHVLFDWIRQRIQDNPRFDPILEGFRKNGFRYLLFLRFVPVFPFWLVNVSLALTDIRPAIFLGGTVIGMIPASALITRLGFSLRNHSFTPPFLTGQQEVLLSILGLLSILPILVRRFMPIFGSEK